MRKALFLLLCLTLLLCCAVASADTEYQLAACSGKLSINENSYIVLTPENLDDHPDMLNRIGKSKEELLADWEARGVVLQAWTKKYDACLEVIVIQDEESQKYFDLERQTKQVRNDYLNEHRISNKKYIQAGYSFTEIEWKKQKLGGNFLKLKYKRLDDTGLCRGLIRKTVRNGYTIILDYQCFNRLTRGTDENNLNKIANTVQFEVVEPTDIDQASSGSSEGGTVIDGSASGLLQVTVPPPAETNESTFTIQGTTSPGAHLIGVAMRWSSSTPLKFTADATRAGNFKLKITLPEEGVWLVTLNLEINGKIVAEKIFDTTTYNRTVLPVVLDSEVPEQISGNELVLSGVTSKGVTVQCIVTNGAYTFDKMIRTNGTGKFKFKVPVAAEGTYDITLAFSKKNYDTKRLTYTTVRNLSAQDKQAQSAGKAIHPSYTALNKKAQSYIGKTMVYNAYIVKVEQSGDDWLITAALRSNKKGYSDLLMYAASEDPGLTPDTRVKLYGTFVGPYMVQSEEEDTSYPSFDFLFSD